MYILKSSHKIYIYAFAVRIITLAIIMMIGEDLSTGLIGSTNLYDDVRYLYTAQLYIKKATSIIDIPVFQHTMDTVEMGYIHDSFTSMWDWMVCILYYILRNEILIKIVNIVFAVVSVKCIYDICKELYGQKVAKLASSLYAFLPYPVIFSCFLYKDQFYTMITLLLLKTAIRCAGSMTLKDIFIMALLVLISALTRTGLVVLVAFALILIIYKKGKYKIDIKKVLFVIPICIILSIYIVYLSWDAINTKLVYYVLEFAQDSEVSTIDFFLIKTPYDICKYPLSLFVMLLQPINTSCALNCWMDVAGFLNIVAVPIAVGNVLYFLNVKQKKSYLFWLAHLFFMVTIITSLNITRHQFYLQPYIMMIFAVYCYRMRNRFVLIASSATLCLLFVGLWLR